MGGWRRVTHVQQYLFSVAGAGARSGTPAPEFPLSATKVIEAAVTRLLAAKLLPGVLELMPNACILAANGAVCSYSAVAVPVAPNISLACIISGSFVAKN